MFNKYNLALIFLLFVSVAGFAAEDDSHKNEHGGQIFHAFQFEADYGEGRNDPVMSWDLKGWVGGDINRLALKSEGEIVDSETEQAELWALYSRNIATFWDLQIGIRQDFQPESSGYFVIGIEGLAPYFFETEAHLFVSDEGDVSLRLHQENDLLISQRFILQPYFEANLFAQDVDELDIAAGLANAELGLQMRYEISRKFAPYLDLRYERKFGQTSSIAKRKGEENDDFIVSAGLRLMF